MELIMALFVLIVVFSIGFLVGNKQLLNKEINSTKEDKKIPPCVGHELESQRENDVLPINFMHNWIQEKSGKKPIVKKRKPKSVKENEADFDLGGSE